MAWNLVTDVNNVVLTLGSPQKASKFETNHCITLHCYYFLFTSYSFLTIWFTYGDFCAKLILISYEGSSIWQVYKLEMEDDMKLFT